ncbi:MAG: pyrroline-5-carboxylate reductase, partial [Waddliaceae bacterium]|nr:pyrroline-5-carboxylate reductase [Waddliaceae bacterium]
MSNKKIGIIGVGNMGLAIISGAISSGVFTKDDIIAFEKNEVRQKHIESTIGICFASSLQDLARCELILMAVKPQDLEDVSKSLSEYILPETLVVSVAGGVTTETLQKYLSGKGHIIRVMPNTPVSVCSGVSALCIGDRCTEEDIKKTQKLFQSLGTTLVIKEDMFDAISALSGSGPAYFFYMIEALAASAIQRGFDEKTALNLVIETCYGAIKL